MFKILNLIFVLFFCTHNCWSQIYNNALKLETVWQFESENLSENKIIQASEGLIISLSENKFILLDPDLGEVLWSNEVTGEIISEPFVKEDYLYITTSLPNNENKINKFSLKTGIQVGSQTNIENPLKNSNASDNKKELIIQKNTIQKIINNKIIWKTKIGGNINDVTVNKYGILVSSSDNFLYGLNNKNGNKIWKIRFTNKVSGANLLTENIGIVNVYAESKVQIFDIQKGKLIDFFLLKDNEFPVNKPLISKGTVILQTNDKIICLKLKK
jgi:outer membrane protein assembly factor BamB